MYKIHYDVDLEKVIKKIPKYNALAILKKIGTLSVDPRPEGSIKLTGREAYRIRIGNYRVIY